ncbi:MAG: hypothetical protein N2110_02020 [Flavobacteriales bacterium]|nr:hypothetical protein [Flavobacteriales bacterium]MCX7767785.1 hypothetical protein [Flavobacteriales bacterium]MDW8410630.1 hypothetical protein [Flavobacteriales bacterium]
MNRVFFAGCALCGQRLPPARREQAALGSASTAAITWGYWPKGSSGFRSSVSLTQAPLLSIAPPSLLPLSCGTTASGGFRP